MTFNKQRFASILKNRLQETRLSLAAFADLAGLSRMTVYDLVDVRKSKAPSINTLLAISEILDIPVEQLICTDTHTTPTAMLRSLVSLAEQLPISINIDSSQNTARLVSYDGVLSQFLAGYKTIQLQTKDPASRAVYCEELLALSTYQEVFCTASRLIPWLAFFAENGDCAEVATIGYRSLCKRYPAIVDTVGGGLSRSEVSHLLLTESDEALDSYSIALTDNERACLQAFRQYLTQHPDDMQIFIHTLF